MTGDLEGGHALEVTAPVPTSPDEEALRQPVEQHRRLALGEALVRDGPPLVDRLQAHDAQLGAVALEVLSSWVAGERLTSRGDEASGRVAAGRLEQARPVPRIPSLDRLVAAAILSLPPGHPERDEQLARELLERHLGGVGSEEPLEKLATLATVLRLGGLEAGEIARLVREGERLAEAGNGWANVFAAAATTARRATGDAAAEAKDGDGMFAELNEYELNHLVVHLVAAGALEDVDGLLRLETPEGRNAWYEAKDHPERHTGSSFADDVRRARAALADMAARELAAGGHAPSVGHQARMALLEASATAVSTTTSAPLLDALLHEGIWSPERALRAGREMAHPLLRAEALACAAAFVAGPARSELVRESLQAAGEIHSRYEWLARAIKRLAPLFTAETVADARRTADLSRPVQRGESLAAIAPFAPEAERREMVESALDAVEHEHHRGQDYVEAEEIRLETYARVGDYLEPGRRADAHALAADLAARRLRRGEPLRRDALEALVASLPAEHVDVWLERASGLEDERGRAEAIAALASRLTGRLVDAAVTSAFEIADPAWRAHALAALAPAWPEPLRETLVRGAVAAAAEIDEPGRFGRVAAQIGPLTAPDECREILRSALRAAATLDDVGPASYLSACLAAASDEPALVEPAIDCAVETQDERALKSLAGSGNRRLRTRLLEAAERADDDHDRFELLWPLVHQLPPDLVGKALRLCAGMADEQRKALILRRLAPSLAPADAVAQIDWAEALQSPAARAWSLTAIAGALDAPDGAELALRVLNQLVEQERRPEGRPEESLPSSQTFVFLGAAPREALFDDGWEFVDRWVSPLTVLTDHDPAFAELALSINDPRIVLAAIERMIGRAPAAVRAPLLDKAVEQGRHLQHHLTWAPLLRSIAETLGKEEGAAFAARVLAPDGEVASDLPRTAYELVGMLPDELMNQAVSALAPTAGDVDDAAFKLLAAGARTGWAVRLARRIADPYVRAQTLAAVAQREDADERAELAAEAFSYARVDDGRLDTSDRAHALRAVLPALHGALREQAVAEAVPAIAGTRRARVGMLMGLAAELADEPPNALLTHWSRALSLLVRNPRRELLEDLAQLAPMLVAIGGGAAACAMADGVADARRWWS